MKVLLLAAEEDTDDSGVEKSSVDKDAIEEAVFEEGYVRIKKGTKVSDFISIPPKL